MSTPLSIEQLKPDTRVVHPDWLGKKRAGRVVCHLNQVHTVVLFDGWDRPVRAVRINLELEGVA